MSCYNYVLAGGLFLCICLIIGYFFSVTECTLLQTGKSGYFGDDSETLMGESAAEIEW